MAWVMKELGVGEANAAKAGGEEDLEESAIRDWEGLYEAGWEAQAGVDGGEYVLADSGGEISGGGWWRYPKDMAEQGGRAAAEGEDKQA